jgi:hypothetical protein
MIANLAVPRVLLVALALAVAMTPLEVSPIRAATGVTDWIVYTPADYTSIQQAIDATSGGASVVYIPAGSYTVNTQLVFPANRRITLMGAGRGATVLQFSGVTASSYILMQYSGQILSDLDVIGSGTGTTRGVVITPGAANISGVTLSNVRIFSTPSWAFEAEDVNGSIDVIYTKLEHCEFGYNLQGGLVKLDNAANSCSITNCSFVVATGPMLMCDGSASAVAVRDCAFRTETVDSTFVVLKDAASVELSGCYFSEPSHTGAYFVECYGHNYPVTIADCYFVRTSASATGPKIVFVPGSPPPADTTNGVYGLTVANPCSFIPVAGPLTGNDDIVINSDATKAQMWGGAVADNAGYQIPRVQRMGPQSFGGNYDDRLHVPNVDSATTRNGLPGPTVGDVIFNRASGKVEIYNGTSWVAL